MRRNENEYVNTSITDIIPMKNINKRYYNRKRNITNERKWKFLKKKRNENPAKYLEREKRRLRPLKVN